MDGFKILDRNIKVENVTKWQTNFNTTLRYYVTKEATKHQALMYGLMVYSKGSYFVKIGYSAAKNIMNRITKHALVFDSINPIFVFPIQNISVEQDFHTLMSKKHKSLVKSLRIKKRNYRELYVPSYVVFSTLRQYIKSINPEKKSRKRKIVSDNFTSNKKRKMACVR